MGWTFVQEHAVLWLSGFAGVKYFTDTCNVSVGKVHEITTEMTHACSHARTLTEIIRENAFESVRMEVLARGRASDVTHAVIIQR